MGSPGEGMENVVKIYTTSLSQFGGLVMLGLLSSWLLVKKIPTLGFASCFGHHR